MKKWILAFGLVLFGFGLWADEKKPAEKKEKTTEEKKEESTEEKKTEDAVKVKGNQDRCPIDGAAKLDKSIFVDYQGQRLYFCKTLCSERFWMVPEDCFGMLENRSCIADNIQDKCLLADEKLTNHDLFVKLPGRKLYFCCNDCHEDFKKDSKKHLKKLEEKEKKK